MNIEQKFRRAHTETHQAQFKPQIVNPGDDSIFSLLLFSMLNQKTNIVLVLLTIFSVIL